MTSVIQREILYDFACIWNLKKKTNEQTQLNRNSHRYREQMGACQREGHGERREISEGD